MMLLLLFFFIIIKEETRTLSLIVNLKSYNDVSSFHSYEIMFVF